MDPPPPGWLKLNTNGAVDRSNGFVSCEGVIRDENGKRKIGFHKATKACSVLQAKLWGVLEGLKVAWKLRTCKLLIEVDRKDMCKGIKTEHLGTSRQRSGYTLVKCCN
ncbi:hypothetical protein F3Y22_tig00007889pilonHSYRG00001 [Hibiscus syriacus]|uniref:RNase H type-1 domain-containing protein n=1 Tax=Hibiscus syriacus TaxID=106335 RepID=A0A6A3CBH1_HIBSY|nr:hypothetical protein F3Y22_tig00007889pilonHSYRG00001 [Hibiscus syriacus]